LSEEPTIHSARKLSLRFNIPISKTREFWDSLRAGRMTTTRCKDCGLVSFPPQADCPVCMRSEQEWVELEREGELVTFTQVRMTPTSFIDHDPYVVGIARLNGSGLKVLSWVEDASPERLKPGDKVRIEFRKNEQGDPYYVFVLAGRSIGP